MPIWAWIVLSLAGVSLLLLFLFRVRYELDWNAGGAFTASLEYGFPGYMRPWNFSRKGAEPETSSAPSKPSGDSALKKAGRVISFFTDPKILRDLWRYGRRFIRLLFGLLNLEVDCALSYSDPARLGRAAGYWYAAQPFLGTRRIQLRFLFQDQTPALRLRLAGGFSAARALAYGFMALVALPWRMMVRLAIAKFRA